MTASAPDAIAVVVVGARGRLGSLVCTEAAKDARFRVHAQLGRADVLASALKGAGRACAIDVATAGATAAHARACADAGVPYVVATTGLTADDERALDDAAKRVAILSAANLSVSAHVAALLVREAAGRLSAYDVEIVEVHHKRKKDAPSGTALMLARAAADARAGAGALKRGRDGVSPRAAGEIGIAAVRGGDVVGEHTAYFLGDGERVEIAHRVTDRAVFARGALAAAAFLVDQRAGRYTMSDVIGVVGVAGRTA